MSSSITYVRYEVLRTVRNARFFIFSLVFPLILFFTIAGPNRNISLGGIPFAQYYMVGMASWGTMAAVIAGGARIAAERSVGWNRQLRITPLSTRTYFRAKVLTGYMMALVSIVLLYAAGLSLGVRMPAGDWVQMTVLLLVGLIPFAVLGILLGHLLTVDSMGPAMGGITSLFALLGGSWGPIGGDSGVLHDIVQCLPSYWLVQAGHVGIGDGGWGATGWIVVGAWTAVLGVLAGRAYRRDTNRA
jgi:ABC-2 type transport system permease protein